MSADEGNDFAARLARVDALLQGLEVSPDRAACERARELLQAVFELHARGLGELLELAQSSPHWPGALDGRACANSLLLLHGLHPTPLRERVQGALDELRVRLSRARASVSLQSVEADRVTVILEGDPALEAVVREALDARAPDAEAVVDVVAPERGLVRLRLRRESAERAVGGDD
jgi:hypothetical protein